MNKRRRNGRKDAGARCLRPVDNFQALPDEAFVRLATVLAVYPVGRSTWWAGIKSGRYPAPVKLGPNTAAWRAGEIRQLLQQQAA
jgi:predicted DNA-binding transcriptional regulator AlpA